MPFLYICTSAGNVCLHREEILQELNLKNLSGGKEIWKKGNALLVNWQKSGSTSDQKEV